MLAPRPTGTTPRPAGTTPGPAGTTPGPADTTPWPPGDGHVYDDVPPSTDAEVSELVDRPSRPPPGPQPGDGPHEVLVTVQGRQLPGSLTVPPGARGFVLFAHGSGSSRLSPRNVAVARVLSDGGIATLLFDLLTPEEARDRARVFDIGLLADRLVGATRWAQQHPDLAALPIGYVGASTGAAAALQAAAELQEEVTATVSRGGRPDLAMDHLADVTAPTLLIVGSRDEVVVGLNEQAQRQLRCPNDLAIVPGATHLFEEPGALEQVAELARDWFLRHLPSPPSRP